jgi:NifU-like protein involved in Fe-S cluster formation
MVKLKLEIGSKATAEALFEGFGCETLTAARALSSATIRKDRS